MPTRKELIASGAEITPLTREEILLQGGELTPLNVKEKVLKGVVGGGSASGFALKVINNSTTMLNVETPAVEDGKLTIIMYSIAGNGGFETINVSVSKYDQVDAFLRIRTPFSAGVADTLVASGISTIHKYTTSQGFPVFYLNGAGNEVVFSVP